MRRCSSRCGRSSAREQRAFSPISRLRPRGRWARSSMLAIEPLKAGDISEISASFAAIGWDKPEQLYRDYLAEQARGTKEVRVAHADGRFAGYITVAWHPSYPPFRSAGIPE